jgi:hypothetical protein
MTHLHSKRSLFSCSATCKSFSRVADELAKDLRGVPAEDLTRALARFDRATSVAVDLAAAPRPTRQDRDGRSSSDRGGGPEAHADDKGARAAAAVLARELRAVPPLAAARIERLAVSHCPTDAANALVSALELVAPAWRRLARLELDYTATTVELCRVGWRPLVRAAAALPALHSLRLAGALPASSDDGQDSLWAAGLQDLELVGVPSSPSLGSIGLLMGAGVEHLSSLSLAQAPNVCVVSMGHITSLKVGGAALLEGGGWVGCLLAGGPAPARCVWRAWVRSKPAVPAGAAVPRTWFESEDGVLRKLQCGSPFAQ